MRRNTDTDSAGILNDLISEPDWDESEGDYSTNFVDKVEDVLDTDTYEKPHGPRRSSRGSIKRDHDDVSPETDVTAKRLRRGRSPPELIYLTDEHPAVVATPPIKGIKTTFTSRSAEDIRTELLLVELEHQKVKLHLVKLEALEKETSLGLQRSQYTRDL